MLESGTATTEVAQWVDGTTDEQKSKMNSLTDSANDPYTSTYDKDTKTGTYTLKSGIVGTFTVDVSKKELTSTETEEGEDPEITVFKLK
jgi:hypothetical protein